jgi:hypothetical protein
MLVVGMIAYFSGLRGALWFMWVVIASFPAVVVAIFLIRRFGVGPRLDFGDNYSLRLQGPRGRK